MVFLDVSKAFDRVYRKGLLYKLQCLGIEGNLLNWTESYLTDRYQRVVISGQTSDWASTNAGGPQGSILGPLLFLVFINDIVNDLESVPFFFADDTSLLNSFSDCNRALSIINNDRTTLADWAAQWQFEFHAKKSTWFLVPNKTVETTLIYI